MIDPRWLLMALVAGCGVRDERSAVACALTIAPDLPAGVLHVGSHAVPLSDASATLSLPPGRHRLRLTDALGRDDDLGELIVLPYAPMQMRLTLSAQARTLEILP